MALDHGELEQITTAASTGPMSSISAITTSTDPTASQVRSFRGSLRNYELRTTGLSMPARVASEASMVEWASRGAGSRPVRYLGRRVPTPPKFERQGVG
jgi:hypothetical protein